MNSLKEKLEKAIEETLQKGEHRTAAELTRGYAALRSAEAQERVAASIERTLTAFAGIGDAIGELSRKMNPAELTKMMEQHK